MTDATPDLAADRPWWRSRLILLGFSPAVVVAVMLGVGAANAAQREAAVNDCYNQGMVDPDLKYVDDHTLRLALADVYRECKAELG